MAKKIMQYRFFEENGNQNQPNTSYEMITKNNLINGAIFSNRTPITQLGIQTLPGTKFYLNNSVDPVEVGITGIYELDLSAGATITALRFDKTSLETIINNTTAFLIVDTVYETEEN